MRDCVRRSFSVDVRRVRFIIQMQKIGIVCAELKPQKGKNMIDIIALHALFGTSIPISKKLLSFTSPVLLTGLRMTIAGSILMLFNMIWQKKAVGMQRKLWSYYAQIILIGVYFRYILRYWGLQHMPAVKMGFLVNSTPFVAAIFSYIFFNELLTRKQWIGLTLGFLGYVPILLTTSSSEQKFGEMFFISWPEIAIFASVIAYCYYMTISRRLIRDHNHSASLTNGIRMFGGGFLALLTAFAVEPIAISNVGEFTVWLAVLIVISNIICHNFCLHLLKYYSITFLSFTDFLSPIFTGIYSWYFLKETITWNYFAGAAVIIFGLYLFYQDELGVSHAKGKSVAAA